MGGGVTGGNGGGGDGWVPSDLVTHDVQVAALHEGFTVAAKRKLSHARSDVSLPWACDAPHDVRVLDRGEDADLVDCVLPAHIGARIKDRSGRYIKDERTARAGRAVGC